MAQPELLQVGRTGIAVLNNGYGMVIEYANHVLKSYCHQTIAYRSVALYSYTGSMAEWGDRLLLAKSIIAGRA